MGQTEIEIFIILIGIIIMIFIIGIIMFIFQYRKRKLLHEKEKISIEKQHKIDLLKIQSESQQEAMQHIGQEIHDNVGQKLTLASLYSRGLAYESHESKFYEKANAIGKIIDESLADLRQLSKTLTNPHLASANIILLLKEEAAQINAAGICYLAIQTDEAPINISSKTKNILFRLLQEFIQNSLKHSCCRKIVIEFKKLEQGTLITASDDGDGFDLNSASNGIGLQNMKRRAEQIKALYRIDSEPGKGTSVSLHLPD